MITRLKLGHLSVGDTTRLSELVNLWSATSRSTMPINQETTERAVSALYTWYGLPVPKIIWCQSPWQIADIYMVSNLCPQAGASSLDLRHSLASEEEESSSGSDENSGDWRSFLARMFLAVRDSGSVSTSPVTRRFLPIRESRVSSVFYAMRRPLLPPILRPSIDLNTVTFTPSCVMDVGFAGRNTLRRTAEDFGWRSGLQPLAQMVSQWPSYLIDNFADESTRTSVRSFLLQNRSFGNSWPLEGYHQWQMRHGHPNKFSEASSLIPNLIWFSSWSSNWIPMYAFLLEQAVFSREETAELQIWLELARNACAYSFFGGVCLVSNRPQILSCDQRGRLHHQSTAALSFADGRDLYSWFGVTCPREIIEEPDKITITRIETEENAEIKRILIDRFGVQRYLTESNNAKVHEDEFGTLYVKRVDASEPIAMVRVTNSTPESDGTYKEYFLRVPPTVTTAREAVAWTFNLDSEDYNPGVET
jgi:hypothetical protein